MLGLQQGKSIIIIIIIIIKHRRANAETRDIGTINSNKRIVATVYSLGTLFVSGIHVQIPCIKEIMMMIIIIVTIKYLCHE
jgi:hypothetical protein